MNDFYGFGGDGRFMTMNRMGNTISVLDFVGFFGLFPVNVYGSASYRCSIIFWLSIAEFGTKDLEERNIMPTKLSPSIIRLRP